MAAVESEGEFVKVGVQMALADSALMRSQQPALQQRGHEMNAREVPVETLRIALGHRLEVPVA